MSSTNKTANLQLHSWVRTDPVVCEDFNDNFNKIDEAVAALDATRGNCEIYVGSYTGTGAKTVTLTFPKPPVYLTVQIRVANSYTSAGFVANGLDFYGHYGGSDSYNRIFISGTTVMLEDYTTTNRRNLNMTDVVYSYMAFAPAV